MLQPAKRSKDKCKVLCVYVLVYLYEVTRNCKALY